MMFNNFFYASDLVTQYLPWYDQVQQFLRRGQLPHLVSHLYPTAYPLLAEGETGVLSPINAAILFLFPLSYAVTLLYFIYALLAITGTYCFLRLHKLDKLSGLLGGLVFVLSGFMVSRYFQPAIIFASALLPWGMWAVIKKRTLLPFIIYLQVTAGHLQIALISILAYVIYALLHARLKVFVFVILGLTLSAVQLLPSFRLYQLADRRHWDPMVRFTYSLPPSHLLTYLNPAAFGISAPGDNLGFTQFGGSFWEFNLTIWLLPFLLSLVPLFFIKQKHVLVLYLLWLVFLLLSFGGYTPIYRLLAKSPAFPFRAPSRFLLIPTFAAAALAGFGFNAIIKKLPALAKLIFFAAVLATVIMQLSTQLQGYIVTQDISHITYSALTTPLPLSQPVSLQQFIIPFRYGLAISLLSLCLALFLLV